MKVNYFNRSVSCGYSIHRVFSIIVGEVDKQADVTVFNAPESGTSLKTFRKNFAFVMKHRDANVINHITGDVNYFAFMLKGYRCVVTVHDIGLMKKFKGIKKKLWNFWWIQSLKNADKVTFISSYTKNEVLKYVKLPESKLVVIPNPVPLEFSFSYKEFNSIKPVILHIGTGSSKNLSNSIEALKNIPCHFRIIGNINNETRILLEKCNIDYSNSINLSNDQILDEYRNCDIVNFPSIHEGFGMPILEGQAVGRAVLSSNLAPMNEVCNGGALLIDPFDIADMHNGYIKLIGDSEFRNKIIVAGLDNVKKYSAERIANEYIKVYKELY